MIDWAASTKTSDLSLKGDYFNVELIGLENLLLQHCKQAALLHPIRREITKEQFKSCIRVRREYTTTSPSGVDLGHYKALVCGHILDPKSEEAKKFKAQHAALITAHVQPTNYVIKYCFTYKARVSTPASSYFGLPAGL